MDKSYGSGPPYGGEAQGYYNGVQPQQQAYQQYQQPGHEQQQMGQMPPPPNYGPQSDNGGNKQNFDQTFQVERPKWNDLWAGILFIAVSLGFVAISGYCLYSYSHTSRLNNGGFNGSNNEFGLNGDTLVLFAFVLVASLVLGYGYVSMARLFTKQFIWISGIINIIMTLATAIYYFYRHSYGGAIVFLIFTIFSIICFISWIRRIPFSVILFQTVVDVSKNYGHVYLVSFLGGLTAALFAAWFAATMVAVYIRFQPGNNPSCSTTAGASGDCSKATVIGLMVYITFAGYWITEWLKNTIHTTISGVYGAWYFNPNNPSKGATRGAARRALTYSFGSISLGSLLVAILDMLRLACSVARNQSGGSGNLVADCAFCILQCILGLVQWALDFVNRYAFSYMALYGKKYEAAYLRSVKHNTDLRVATLHLRRRRGGKTFSKMGVQFQSLTSSKQNDQGSRH